MKTFIKTILVVLLINFSFLITNAQIAINSDGSNPDASAMLDVSSSDKGILIPRMTTAERTAISSPATGLLVYDTDFNTFWYYANSTWNNLSNTILADADADTKIQVEESSDEDIIRFDLGGTEYLRLDSGRIEILNTGGSVFLGEGAGKNDDQTSGNTFIGYQAGYSNTDYGLNNFIGYQAGYSNMDGNNNNFIGYQAGYSNDYGNTNSFVGNYSGYSNVSGLYNNFVGIQSGYSNTNGSYNNFIGTYAGSSNTSGSNNDFIGYRTGYDNTTGYSNSFLGYNTGNNNTTGNKNLFLGADAGTSNKTGSNNVFIGYQAGYNETASDRLYIESSNSSSPLIYGEFDNDLLQINGTLNISGNYALPTTDGSASQTLITDGSGILSWSDLDATLLSDADADTKIQVEESSDEDIIRFDLGGTEYLRLKSGRIEPQNTGNSIFIGEDAGKNDDLSGNYNVFIGYNTGEDNTSGGNNLFLGGQTGISNTTGNNNVFLGALSGATNTTGVGNVFIGYLAGATATGSNKLYIDNTSSSSPLIYGDFDTDKLRINGTLDINNEYEFPTTDGSSNQVLATDGSGILSWSDINQDLGNHTATQNLELNDNWLSNDGGSEGITIDDDGHVGIGITPTNADLEISYSTSTNDFSLLSIGYLNTGGAGTSSYNGRFAIYADGRISGIAFIAHSDERIKNIIGKTNNENDLAILNKIEITDYTMKDNVRHDDKIIKKVIAQQVKSVYPQAVSANTTQVIPDIYQTATIDENGWVNLTTDLKIGEKIQIIFDDKKELLEVLEIKGNAFRVPITNHQSPATVFIYGRQVSDFHTVDYEAISMLNVSATQQLAKEVEELKKENKLLKAQVSEIQDLKIIVQQLQAQLEN